MSKTGLKNFFNFYSKYYEKDVINKYFKNNHKVILDELNFLDKKKIVDIGCGPAELGREILSRWPNNYYLGVDISDKMIKIAKNRLCDFENARFCIGDVMDLNLKSNKFDLVLNSISFHHYEKPSKALNEMIRILKPSGTLIILDSVRSNTHIMPLYWDFVESRYCYSRHLTIKEFDVLLSRSKNITYKYKIIKHLFPANHILISVRKLKCC